MTAASTSAPLLLVDGSNYLFRAFHASRQADLRTSQGVPSGAVRVMTNMLRRLLKEHPDSHMAVVFDAKGKSFRHDLFADYKGHRKPMDDDLRVQIEPIHNIIRAMGLPLLIIPGVEADDVLGTLATEATRRGIDTYIFTGDKDMAQLVSEHVTLVDTMKEQKLDRAGVEAKFGIPPELIIDYLALMGDSSDNIPGMPGVGQKTALALLQGLGGIDAIEAQLDRVAELGFRGSKSFAEKFAEHREQVQLSRELATIKTDVDLEQGLDDLVQGPVDREQLLGLYREFEFRQLIDELEAGAATTATATATATAEAPAAATTDAAQSESREYSVILEQADFDAWLVRLQAAGLFAFDTETTSLNYMEAQIVGVSFAVQPGEAAYLPLAHDYLGAPEQLDRERVLAALKPLLEDPAVLKVGQNLKYDRNVLRNHGIELRGIAYDSMLESYVLNSTEGRHDMDSLAERYLGVSTTSFEAIAGKGAKQLTFNQIELEQAGPYAAEDADITLRLHQALWPRLEAEPKLAALCQELELPLVPILSDMERAGALIAPELLARQSLELAERMQELEQAAFAEAGEEFNLGSPKQLGEILFEKKGLPVLKKTPKGAPSTAEAVLVDLALDYPLPKLILEYRSLSKLKSTYTDKLPQMICAATGRVHTSYHQAVAATGRLSSSDPNLQNIPIRTAEGRRIRQAFIAPPGYKLVAADYSQIELRIMAHLSEDAGLLKAFAEGADIHRATAAEVFALAPEQVSDEQRRSAKAINFGLIYGMSAFGLAKQLGVSRASAQEYIDLYFERYPGVQRYMEETREQAREQGYVETLFGRRLYLPEIKARNVGRRQAAERTAINAPMQGTAADIIKRAMLAVDRWLQQADLDMRMLMQVHDELIFEVRETDLAAALDGIRLAMEGAAELRVPLKVEIGVGANWDEAH